eukprot:TRINITY_DN16098_c0_g1_i3.p1 TRINITY_DN16098_c0_g1~~TRINITY_DN16098_c0_g1_i3.p1  ORF type:complete len:669 (+),score=151.06 TRINITY_DN16098_c0_g1_i3:31-2007(+)
MEPPGEAGGEQSAASSQPGGRRRSESPERPHSCVPPRSRSRSRSRSIVKDVPPAAAPQPQVNISSGSISRGPGPAAVTARLRQLVGDAAEELPVLVGLVCARIAVPSSFNPKVMHAELLTQMPSPVKQEALEEFVAWLDAELTAGAAAASACSSTGGSRPPADPRLSPRLQPHLRSAVALMKDGDMVTLHGLSKRPDLNGRHAVILRTKDDSQPGRFVVRLEGAETSMAIRPDNLQPQKPPPLSPRSRPADADSARPPPPLAVPDSQGALPKAPPGTNWSKPQTGGATSSAASSVSASQHSQGGLFNSALEKLRAKAEAEQRGEPTGAAVDRGRKRKEKEEQESARRGGIGSAKPAGSDRREQIFGSSAAEALPKAEPAEEKPKLAPVAFIAAEDPAEAPSRKVQVFDPRNKGGSADSDDEDLTAPGVIKPRIVDKTATETRKHRWQRPVTSPLQQQWTGEFTALHTGAAAAATTLPHSSNSSHSLPPPASWLAAAGAAGAAAAHGDPYVATTKSPFDDTGSSHHFNSSWPPAASAAPLEPAKTAVTSAPAAPPRGLARLGLPNKSAATAATGSCPGSPGKPKNLNLTLVVSDQAREEDKAQREVADKRKAMEEGKRQMLAKLTKQLQLCLARVQSGAGRHRGAPGSGRGGRATIEED